jgi:glycosyltransferase involved in cell wall biosynthesis
MSKSILFVSHDNQLLGATRSLLELAVGLRDKGWTIHLIFPASGPATKYCEACNVPFEIISFPLPVTYYKQLSFLKRLSRILKVVTRFRSLARLIGKGNYDIVYLNTQTLYLLLPFVSRKQSIILHVREFGFIGLNMHYVLPHLAVKWCMRKAGKILFNSNAVRLYFEREIDIKGEVLYNGVMPRKEIIAARKLYLERSVQHNGTQVFTIGTVGALNPTKGQQVIINALHLLKRRNIPCRLLVVGDGKMRNELVALAKELDVYQETKFIGNVSDPSKYYLEMDVFVHVAAHEAFGRVVAEAQAYGIAVVAGNAGGLTELIEHNHSGLLCEINANALAETLEHLYHNTELRLQLGATGHDTCLAKFNAEGYVENFIHITDSMS